MKAAIVGYSGAGKSTLAKNLGVHYGAPVLYMDSLSFAPGWISRPVEDVERDLRPFLDSPDWVIDGNYKHILWEERMESADLIIFLDFSRLRCFWQGFRRYLKYRGRSRDSAAQGCHEKFDWEFMKWILYEGRTSAHRTAYETLCRRYGHKTVVLHNIRERDAYLTRIASSKKMG